MNPTPRQARIGLIAALVWSVAVVWGGLAAGAGSFLPPPIAVPGALIAPGFVLAAMILRIRYQRFFSGSQGQEVIEVDQHVSGSTIEQAVLAVLIWPFVALTLGGTVVLVMGFAFAIARLMYWYGAYRAPVLYAFGSSATFAVTGLAGLWALIVWF